MNSKRISTALLVLVAITFLTVLAFHVRIGATADSVAILKTAGMTCGSCARTIAETLERVHGVAVTEVDVEGGWIIVGYDTRTVKPESLVEKVKGAGFESTVYRILTPEQFKRVTGKDMGTKAAHTGSCGNCGS